MRLPLAAAPGFTLVCVLVTVLVVFGWPVAALITFEVTGETVIVQLSPAFSVGTVKFSAVAPTTSAGVLVVPTHVPPIVVLDTDMPESVSVNFRLVSAIVLALVSVNVMRLVPPCEIGLVPKALAMVGGLATKSVAVLEAVPAAPVSVVATPEVVLLYVPVAAAVTATVIVQLAPAGMLPAVT